MLTNIPTNNDTDLNNLIYAGAKLVCGKVGALLKNKNKMAKPGWEIRLETQIRNLWQQAKMIRQKKNMRCWDQEEKATQLEQKIQLKDKSEDTSKRKTKKILKQDQTIQKKKQDLPKQWKKNLPASKGRKCEDSPATKCKWE